MDKYYFSRSQENIWMNENAYPGRAVNTIGIRMYFPEHTAEAVVKAVDHIIKAADIFRAVISLEHEFELLDRPVNFGEIGIEICRCQANEAAAVREKLFLSGKLYDAVCWPIKEGGCLLSFCFHHVIIDGYGMCLVAQQILNFLDHQPVVLPIFFKKEIASSVAMDSEKVYNRKFWLGYFKDLDTKECLFERAVTDLTKSSYRYRLPQAMERRMESYAKKHQVSIPSMLSAAFSIYMSQAMRCEDVVFHMPRLNRLENQKKVLGCYTIMVPVRVKVGSRDGFSVLCQRAAAQGRLASMHKSFDYQQILADIQAQGGSFTSLSQYTLNFYTTRISSRIPYELELSVAGEMYHHLVMNVFHLNGSYEICYDVRDEIYDRKMTQFFHKALLEILDQGMNEGHATEICAENYNILSAEERYQLLVQLKGAEIAFDESETIPSLFQKAVLRYREKYALFSGSDSYTYQELQLVVNRVANALIKRDLRQGDFVMFMLSRDIRLLPVILGILVAGGVFVPVDPGYPKDRIDYMIENCQAAMLISDSKLELAEKYDYIAVDSLLACEDERTPQIIIRQQQPAYCIYTSGTTGKPKGTVISHRGIVNITMPENNPFNRDICENGRGILAIGSICFDISLFEFFVPLFNGMFIELAGDNTLADPAKLSRYIKAHGVNILHCTPSRLSAYLNHAGFAGALRQIEVILSAGEVLPKPLIHRIKDEYGIRIYNGYGPTEATIGATITEAFDIESIGRPIANTGILVVDEKKRLLPLGVLGELAIYGSGVGIGYLGLEELTKERFCEIEGHRAYCSGDLGYYKGDGRIIYKGRNDQQIKLRGLRLEPAEIENMMMSFAGVVQSCVVVRKIGENEHLVGFYTRKPEVMVNEEALKAHIKQKLALYMVPDILQELVELPHTAGGKLDYQALSEIPVQYVRKYRKPKTKLEQVICNAFEVVLEQKPVGMEDHFFELGGTSLDVVKLIVEIKERIYDAELDYGALFQYATPALLAGYLMENGEGQTVQNYLPKLNYDGFCSTWEHASQNEAAASLGRVLLTGATGYLGIHLLKELLSTPELTEHIYCLVRQKGKLTAKKRLLGSLFYYHDQDYSQILAEKVTVIEGDLTDPQIYSHLLSISVDSVLHAAANVAHFAYGDALSRMNTGSVKSLLSFCKEKSAQLIHISTISIGGVYPAEKPPLTLRETDLFIGQEIHSAYVLSKYMAEYEALKAASTEGVRVKLMRVGNLQGRVSDGEFQMNINENAFARQLSGYVKLGKVPKSLYESYVNFSPVDEVARIILLLARADAGKRVFHVYPEQQIKYAALFEEIKSRGHQLSVVSEKEFQDWTDIIRRTKDGKLLMEKCFIDKANLLYHEVKTDNSLTQKLLSEWKEEWTVMTEEYFKGYIAVLDGMSLFDR